MSIPLRFVVLDLHALTKNMPRTNGDVDPLIRKAILASIIKSNITTALTTAETCYYKAAQAYQFGASSYTHQALVACLEAKATLNEMLAELVDN
jgi:hypothetical protein